MLRVLFLICLISLSSEVNANNKDQIINKLKKGGVLIIGTPLIGTLLSNYFGKYYRLYNKSHEILFNLKSLDKLMRKNRRRNLNIKERLFFLHDLLY